MDAIESARQELSKLFLSLKGTVCEEVSASDCGDIKLSFGRLVRESARLGKKIAEYEYQLGTEYCNWELISCGQRLLDDQLSEALAALRGLTVESVESPGPDVIIYIRFQNGTDLRFLYLDADDEIFYARSSDYRYFEFHSTFGWKVNDSRVPWVHQ